MKVFFQAERRFSRALWLCAALPLFSCAGAPARTAAPLPLPPALPPVQPAPPQAIMGLGRVSAEGMALFLQQHNPNANGDFIRCLAQYYVKEAAAEGVNHDIAFAQMCLETGFLRYGGLVTPEMNNFCGLGAISVEKPGEVFPNARTGVRAHIQHLKAYASEEPLNGELVDPRFGYVRRGRSPEIKGLAGTWAVDRQYGEKINSILRRLYDFSFPTDTYDIETWNESINTAAMKGPWGTERRRKTKRYVAARFWP